MINTIGVKRVQSLPDVLRRPFLAGMGGNEEPQVTTAGKNTGELFRWMSLLRGVETDAINSVEKRHGELQRFKRTFFTEVTQKRHDEPVADSKLFFAFLERPGNTVELGFERNTPFQVTLGIKENLGVDDIVLIDS